MNVRKTELADAQRAVRVLLTHGVVTVARVGEREFANIRRYLEPVQEALSKSGGYSISVQRHSISLVRRHDFLDTAPTLTRPDGRGFDRVRYALFVLALSALERLGQQTTLSDLARRVRDATTHMEGLPFDPDAYRSRLALGHAVRALEELGAMRLTDGSREAWESADSTGDALYDIERDVCRALFPVTVRRDDERPRFLHQDSSDLGREPTRRARRQRLLRALLERPVVYITDLDEPTQTYLKRESATVAEEVELLTGGTVERRAEGMALVDAGRRFSRSPFPKGDSANQAALLLTSALCERVQDLPNVPHPHVQTQSHELEERLLSALGHSPQSLAVVGAQGPFAHDALLMELGASLVQDLGPGLSAAHAENPGKFVKDAIGVLTVNDLVRPVTGGVVLMPMLARYREVAIEASEELSTQLSLGM
jgi:uncharacterized protein (TIGR02678 family)